MGYQEDAGDNCKLEDSIPKTVLTSDTNCKFGGDGSPNHSQVWYYTRKTPRMHCLLLYSQLWFIIEKGRGTQSQAQEKSNSKLPLSSQSKSGHVAPWYWQVTISREFDNRIPAWAPGLSFYWGFCIQSWLIDWLLDHSCSWFQSPGQLIPGDTMSPSCHLAGLSEMASSHAKMLRRYGYAQPPP